MHRGGVGFVRYVKLCYTMGTPTKLLVHTRRNKMGIFKWQDSSRLQSIKDRLNDQVTKTVASSGKSRREVLSDISDVIEDSLRKHDEMEFTGKNWGAVCKLVVIDDLLLVMKGDHDTV